MTTPEQRKRWRDNEARKKAQAMAAALASQDPFLAKVVELQQAAAELKELRDYETELQQRVDTLGREMADFLAGLPKLTN